MTSISSRQSNWPRTAKCEAIGASSEQRAGRWRVEDRTTHTHTQEGGQAGQPNRGNDRLASRARGRASPCCAAASVPVAVFDDQTCAIPAKCLACVLGRGSERWLDGVFHSGVGNPRSPPFLAHRRSIRSASRLVVADDQGREVVMDHGVECLQLIKQSWQDLQSRYTVGSSSTSKSHSFSSPAELEDDFARPESIFRRVASRVETSPTSSPTRHLPALSTRHGEHKTKGKLPAASFLIFRYTHLLSTRGKDGWSELDQEVFLAV